MTDIGIIKKSIYQNLQDAIELKIVEARKSVKSVKDSRNIDTKSSVGDKYETGRAMMQIELEKNEIQLNKALEMKAELSRIDINSKHNRVEVGSLVITNQGNYFISLGVGKLEIDDQVYYAISLASPIGQLLRNKITGDCVHFQNKELKIKKIG